MTWLSNVPVQEHHRAALAQLMPDSGKWLLTSPRFLNWQESSASETFWLYGIRKRIKDILQQAYID